MITNPSGWPADNDSAQSADHSAGYHLAGDQQRLGNPCAILDKQPVTRSGMADAGSLPKTLAALEEHDNAAVLCHSMIENLPLGIFRQDKEGRFTLVNSRFCELIGRKAADILNHTEFDIFPAEVADRYREQNNKILFDGKQILSQEEWLQFGKQPRYWETSKYPLCDSDGIVGIQGVITDVTEYRLAEKQLKREQILLRTVIDILPDGVYSKDINCRKTLTNPADARNLGYNKVEEVLGKDDFNLLSRQDAAAMIVDDQTVIQSGTPVINREEHFTNKAGLEIWLQTSKVPLRNEQGRIIGLVGIGHDITNRKRAEEDRKEMEIQLRHAQKMESIGQLAAGIAHEINTPMQYIGDNTRFLMDAFKDIAPLLQHYTQLVQTARAGLVPPEMLDAADGLAQQADIEFLHTEIPKTLDQSLEGVRRVTKIVRAMKDFSHPGSVTKTPSDLNSAIESTITVARNEWKYVADMILDFQPDLPLVTCVCGEINQVILNLVINAAHAIKDALKEGQKGSITVSTRRDEDWVEIRINDSGTGIPDAIRGRIFDPFFTTKPVGKGTGQGLAIAHSVITDKHGGTITFETQIGKGTTFIVRLPITEKTSATSAAQSK
jgi:PAS domain S-box-containing protein